MLLFIDLFLFEEFSDAFIVLWFGVFAKCVIYFFNSCAPREIALFLLDFMNGYFVCGCAFT